MAFQTNQLAAPTAGIKYQSRESLGKGHMYSKEKESWKNNLHKLRKWRKKSNNQWIYLGDFSKYLSPT